MFSLAQLATITLLAQEGGAPAAGGGDEVGLFQLLMPFMLIGLLYYTMFVLPNKTRDRRLNDLASSLKEKDHVLTTGGIFGVVTNVQRDAGRVTLRVDETSGAKIRVTIDAISRVLDDDKTTDKTKASGEK